MCINIYIYILESLRRPPGGLDSAKRLAGFPLIHCGQWQHAASLNMSVYKLCDQEFYHPPGRPLVKFGVPYNHVRSPEIFWAPLGISWNHLGSSGIIWLHLAWDHLGSSQSTSDHLRTILVSIQNICAHPGSCAPQHEYLNFPKHIS